MQARRLFVVMVSFVLVASLATVTPVQSAVTIETDGEQTFNIGAALRTSFESIENEAPDGSSSKDFQVNEAWLVTNGQLLGEHGALESVDFTFNADINPASSGQDAEQLRMLDANISLNFGEHHNVMAGRILTPTSRANMDGPLFTGTWYFPGALEIGTYPVAFAGRDDGLAYWGTVLDQSLKYQLAAVEGFQPSGNAPDNFLYAGRVTYNVLDPEPAYVNASTYYGSKDILAFSAAYQMESDAFVSGGNTGDYSSFNVEALYEVPLENGHVPTLELSYQDYDKDGMGTATGEGSGYYAVAGYKVGDFRPHARLQKYEFDDSSQANVERMDVGVDYLLNGHNGKITATYTDNYNNDQSSATQDSAFNLGMQFQI